MFYVSLENVVFGRTFPLNIQLVLLQYQSFKSFNIFCSIVQSRILWVPETTWPQIHLIQCDQNHEVGHDSSPYLVLPIMQLMLFSIAFIHKTSKARQNKIVQLEDH